jgi:hypothetical protein
MMAGGQSSPVAGRGQLGDGEVEEAPESVDVITLDVASSRGVEAVARLPARAEGREVKRGGRGGGGGGSWRCRAAVKRENPMIVVRQGGMPILQTPMQIPPAGDAEL